MKKFHTIGLLLLLCSFNATPQLTFNAGQAITIEADSALWQPVAHSALSMFKDDAQEVLDAPVSVSSKNADATIAIALTSGLKKESFTMRVEDRQLKIEAADSHAVAYALMHLSRNMGVSPWIWWADVTPRKLKSFTIDQQYTFAPDVEYRGIFINDEDWGLMPWACRNHEPLSKGTIGPKTTARICELLLRLFANTYWPAMHECTKPFFLTEGNREVAKKYGIYIGTSHCEPMACNAAGEWKVRGSGNYDFVHNAEAVKNFWNERFNEVKDQPVIYTLGMRGVHDGKMQGANSVEEQKNALENVFEYQRGLLSSLNNAPQVFIPYKEVLDVYHAGLNVPDDVTLMWCDDNYGYIRHFPTPQEQARKGGNGIYYHASYWGRPHDYLWLSTLHPELMMEELHTAYKRGIQKMWILNVGDIKPAEYTIQLFMDMACNINMTTRMGWENHAFNFYNLLGTDNASSVVALYKSYYNLAQICKPEFMGNTRTEEKDPVFKQVKNMPWGQKLTDYMLNNAIALSNNLDAIRPQTPGTAYQQLVEYPLQMLSAMYQKMLYAQQARCAVDRTAADVYWAKSDSAYNVILEATKTYNTPKWNGIMSHKPRNLPVFMPLEHQYNVPPCEVDETTHFAGLGPNGPLYIELQKDEPFFIRVPGKAIKNDGSGKLNLYFLPVHPRHDGEGIRIKVQTDNGEAFEVDYSTQGRSEEWKQNILRGAAKVSVPLQPDTKSISVTPLTEGVFFSGRIGY